MPDDSVAAAGTGFAAPPNPPVTLHEGWRMKVCIFGAGAIGGTLAVGLARVPEVDVSVIARGAHLAAIRERGLTLIRDGEETTARVQASDDPVGIGPVDVVFNCLKAHQAWQSAEVSSTSPRMHC
ncbi:MAG: 2-dehydropantoate 2-reductase N-terminal domain-containing protein [Woeseiaceae bacterium]